jgi:hyaluronoglucosaminidase
VILLNVSIRGIVEGFYGKPWSMKQRKDIISFASKYGYNLYIYAPKADPKHRFAWKEPYDKEFIEQFRELVSLGKKEGLDVCMALSPGNSIAYSSAEDLEMVVGKFIPFIDMGMKTVAVFLDDIAQELFHDKDKQKYSGLADAQQDFLNRLHKKLRDREKDIKLIFCPTQYFGETSTEYHRVLGEKLNKEISIMWTGNKVCSASLTAENAQMISQAFQRPVLYWDNYPVNDARMVMELHLGPYENREIGIKKYCEGIVLNPMNQPYASMPVIAAAADFFKSDSYDSYKVLKKVCMELYPDAAQEFYEFSMCNIKSPLHNSEPEYLTDMFVEMFKMYESNNIQAALSLIFKKSLRMEEVYQKLKSSLDKSMLEDISLWLEEFHGWSEVLRLSAVLVKDSIPVAIERYGKDDIYLLKGDISELEEKLKTAVEYQTSVCGLSIMNFAIEQLKCAKGFLKLAEY